MGRVICILLSKHVAKCGRELYFEDKRKVCKVLQATLKEEAGDLDIAAAELFHKEHVCSSAFRDSTGKLMEGKLHEYEGEDKLIKEGRKVHIWGASSRPGRGLIEIAEFKTGNKNCQQILIQIKDEDGKFAEPGDSGAIVCVDDPDGTFVHAIGMVIGDGIGQNGRIYYTLTLSNVLKQLERKTGQKFELY
ncbi:uncharacterized protein LOC123540498 [Mercenaria mercenaria]|uniref:uncharacterized protein LOC123540498 n=1 Tax=Mercenaria mercenaria TaxID=6596 RepID=UPI00234F75AF|nr:uncharacterized protein LOC123540498 [Mercenaria mercenaria]